MIEEGHKVITLQATDNGDQGVSLEYALVGEDVSYAEEIKLLSDSYNNEIHNNSINLKVQHKLGFYSIHIGVLYSFTILNRVLHFRQGPRIL